MSVWDFDNPVNYWRAYRYGKIYLMARSERELLHMLRGKHLGSPKRKDLPKLPRIYDAKIVPPGETI